MANLIKLPDFIGTKASLRHACGTDLKKMLDDMQVSKNRAEPRMQSPGCTSMAIDQMPVNGIRTDGEVKGRRERNLEHGHDAMS